MNTRAAAAPTIVLPLILLRVLLLLQGLLLLQPFNTSLTSFSFPESMTKTTSWTVIDVSAMFVDKMTLRIPLGGDRKI